MAISYSNIRCELREVALKNKPQNLLDISPKGTVPVLQLPNGDIIEESLDIIQYALSQNDPDGWNDLTDKEADQCNKLIQLNDVEFTPWLRKYKYFERYPEHTQEYYLEKAEELFLEPIERAIKENRFLVRDRISFADIAVFPFIRQFASVDDAVWGSSKYTNIKKWLASFLDSDLFASIMVKHKPWSESDEPINFP